MKINEIISENYKDPAPTPVAAPKPAPMRPITTPAAALGAKTGPGTDRDYNIHGNFDIAQDLKPAWAKDLQTGITRTPHPRKYGDTFQTSAYNKREDELAAADDEWNNGSPTNYVVKDKIGTVTGDGRDELNQDTVSYGVDPTTGMRQVTTTVSRDRNGVPYEQTQRDYYPDPARKPGQS